ncbi:MAG: radical SAM protein [Candidatus Geothermarchaeota archaeon]
MLLDLISLKTKVIEELRGLLSEESIAKATKDPHSKRKPRPCGITIHTGIGCSYRCSYCYIYDMGFPAKPTPYPLTPIEIVYSLAINPYVVPKVTLAAFGSVTEPLLSETKGRFIEYLTEIYSYLKLPSQVSTKGILDDGTINALKKGDPNLSILLTIVTLRMHKYIEKFAPNPMDRLEGAAKALRSGFKVAVFIRPIIPGVTDREYKEMLETFESYGIKDLVIGSFRATYTNVAKMKSAGIDVSEIESRLKRRPGKKEQITIFSSDIKSKLKEEALKKGFNVFESACAANIVAHNECCIMCNRGPCGSLNKLTKVPSEEVIEFFNTRGIRVIKLDVDDGRLSLWLDRKSKIDRAELDKAKLIASYVTRRNVVIHYQ